MNGSLADAYLLVEGSDRRVPLINGPSWAVGRSDGCAIVLDSRSVSRLHALLQRMETGDFCVIDLGSRNGTFVNGRRVSIPVTLQDRDQLTFGNERIQFHRAASSGARTPSQINLRNAPTTSLLTHTTVTILVVDIRDFTQLARSVSEELLSQTIGTWFLRVGQAVQEKASWAQKYIGDAVMAVWVHDHVPVSAADIVPVLDAVSRIERATAEISRTLPLPAPLRIGVGLNTGPAIIGTADSTALGETVNMAFRLEAATRALDSPVLLSESTYNALSPDAGAFLRTEVALKGYEGASVAWAIGFDGVAGLVGGAAHRGLP